MNWSKISIEADLDQEDLVNEIQQVFDALFLAAGCPRDMALFERTTAGGGIELFLTPVATAYAAELVHEFHGVACNEPEKTELDLLDGHVRASRLPAADRVYGSARP